MFVLDVIVMHLLERKTLRAVRACVALLHCGTVCFGKMLPILKIKTINIHTNHATKLLKYDAHLCSVGVLRMDIDIDVLAFR